MDEIAGGPSSERTPRKLRWLAGAAVLAAATAGGWHLATTSHRAAHSLSRPTFTSSVTGFGVLGERSLICQQAITTVGGPPAHAPRVDGLVSSGWTGARHPGVTQHGLFFQRAYVYATPRATPWTRVAIESPTTARLFYVSSSEWSGQEPLRPLVVFDPGAGVNAVLFQHCGGHPQRYFGGLITPRPACVVLTVRPGAAGAITRRLRVPVGRPCTLGRGE